MDGWMDACELSATASPVSQQSQKTANRIELNCFLRWDGTGPDSDWKVLILEKDGWLFPRNKYKRDS